MSEHYDFHYQPTGSGAISGQQVLQQTEDAINELGDYVNDNVGGAMDVAQQALETAQNAEQDAQTALDTANSFSSAIQSAQQDASTALSTAQTAQTTASNANNTAIQAQQDASSAVTTANNASGQVNTLSGTVTALGQRVTTAEGNIGQNTSDITALTTRVGTAEGNITTLQNDVSIAQGNASSAMATAGQVKQQAYVFRYSSTALTASSTNSNTLLDNTDNLKIGDKVIDSSGVLFSITAIDTQNSTFTIGTALIDLAQDSDVVHKTGDETIGGSKTFSDTIVLQGTTTPTVKTISNIIQDSTSGNETISRIVRDKTDTHDVFSESVNKLSARSVDYRLNITAINNDTEYTAGVRLIADPSNNAKNFISSGNNTITLGNSGNRWRSVYSYEYYYGTNNTPFTDKFVTTDTNQTITGSKTFSNNVVIYSSDTAINAKYLILRNQKVKRGSTTEVGTQFITFHDKDGGTLVSYETNVLASGNTEAYINVSNLDANSQRVIGGVKITKTPTETWLLPDGDNTVSSGLSDYKWKDVQTYKVNGLVPSSLSLPSDRSARIDISSYFTNLGNGDNNSYTVPANGYIWLHFTNINSALCYSQTSGGLTNYAQTFVRYQGDGQLYAFFPVRKGDNFVVQIYTSSTAVVQNAFFIPCQGNV